MKRIIVITFLFLLIFPVSSLAFNVISKSDSSGVIKGNPFYFAGKDEIRIEYTGNQVTNTQWNFTETGTNRQFSKDLSAPSGSWYTASGFTCVGTYDVKIKNSSGNTLATMLIEIQSGDLQKPKCESDASGDIGNEGSGEGCDVCKLLECPGWGGFMGKLDDIKNAIPPAPNWPSVADTFKDAIVPALVGETKDMLDDLLGRAPEVPAIPEDLPDLDDRDFLGSEPEMQEVPELEGFDKEDITENAPVIEFEEDDTGGFDLSVDPVNSLPDVVPGGPAGEYMREPKEPENPYPGAPKETDADMSGAPIPGDNAGSPPTPGDNTDSPPTPGDGDNKPPTPEGEAYFPGGYKDKPS